MSDPKAMTLEEAVEIVALGRTAYGDKCWQDEFQKAPTVWNQTAKAKAAEREGFARFEHARAIVDQAVKFIAYCRDRADEVDGSMLCEDWKKLRALERGEVQP